MSYYKQYLGIPLTAGLVLLLSACPESDSDSQGLVQIAQTQVAPGHDEGHEEEGEHEESHSEHSEEEEHDHEHDEAKLIEDSQGHEVELLTAYLVLDHFELVRCTTVSGLFRQTLDGILGKAWAADDHGHDHGGGIDVPDDQRNLNRPHVIDLMHTDEASLVLGNTRVPEGRYCELRLSIVPARGDAFGLPEELNLIGAGFYMDWQQDIDGVITEKNLDSTGLSLPITLNLGLPESLDIDAGSHHIVLAVHYGDILEGIDLSNTPDTELAAAVLEGLERSMEIHDQGTGTID